MKIKVGIIFGGRSKEREISFAGGRTVYDNLDKNLFEAVPVFVDSFNNFILLNWEYIYKGSIRDFYPVPSDIPSNCSDFQIYAESLNPANKNEELELTSQLGKVIPASDLKNHFEFAFLCLHGPYGEDGRIQGLFEFLGIPYSGSGIFSSAIGIDKIVQKKLLRNAGFASPEYLTIKRGELRRLDSDELISKINSDIRFPCVVKAPTQGSSIGISVVSGPDAAAIRKALFRSFFIYPLSSDEWASMNAEKKLSFLKTLVDIREGIGIPVKIGEDVIYNPGLLAAGIDKEFAEGNKEIWIESLDGESEVIIESFIEGKEFSSIVIEKPDGTPVCLPPTEIRKGKEVFDYRAKYLPGLSRKITPIQLPDEQIQYIRKQCEALFSTLGFGVYARIDGFIDQSGRVFLNDPNTTSGMMPSSFFFHQAAEIGLNPSQFLTFIIHASLRRRQKEFKFDGTADGLLQRLKSLMAGSNAEKKLRKRIAVIFGGYSSERHISVESGRNIYEKLSSSVVYEPLPVFLTGSDEEHELYTLPVNLMLKDNADDILEKIRHFSVHPIIREIIEECSDVTGQFGDVRNLKAPEQITYQELASLVDEVFIALHGRPGEDGAIQQKLEAVGLPYNGSDAGSSSITIDKFRTNEILKSEGLLVAEHFIVTENEWNQNWESVLQKASGLGFPLIAKPVDDGCSSAVKKIHTVEEFEAYAKLIFRKDEEFDPAASAKLNIKPKEEFPMKRQFLVESLIGPNGAETFLEITGGMLTHYDESGNVTYEVFEASEALSEGEVLSLEEKFLAGQGQNITPARYSKDPQKRQQVSDFVKTQLEKAARVLNIRGYARIDAFVRVFADGKAEVIFIEVNSLPGMTPATCIFHQTAINGYKPYDFIEKIMTFAEASANARRQPA